MNENRGYSVLIADADMLYAKRVKDYFANLSNFEVVKICNNGTEALNEIVKIKPDFVLLDLILPRLDGIGLMQELKKKDISTSIIVSTALDHSKMIQYACQLGAQYYICKPFEMDMLYERMLQIAGRTDYLNMVPSMFPTQILTMDKKHTGEFAADEQNDMDMDVLEARVTDVIRHFGIPAHIKGYQYIREGILLSLKDSDMLSYITKFLYPTIAKHYHTTSSSVERAIRHAIGVSWEKGNAKEMLKEYGYFYGTSINRPTNSEFLSLLVERFRMEMKGESLTFAAKAM